MMNIPLTAKEFTTKSDLMGAFASGLCLIHCLATPFLFLAQAGAASCCESEPWWWHSIDYLFLVISFVAVYYSALNTTLNWMPYALYGGWALLTLFILNEKFHILHLDHLFLFFPALGLVGLHLYNRRYCNCEDEDCIVPE